MGGPFRILCTDVTLVMENRVEKKMTHQVETLCVFLASLGFWLYLPLEIEKNMETSICRVEALGEGVIEWKRTWRQL